MCIFPGCYEGCDRNQPCCIEHWRNAPEVLTDAIRDAWRMKNQRRWLLAVEALRCYWLAVSP